MSTEKEHNKYFVINKDHLAQMARVNPEVSDAITLLATEYTKFLSDTNRKAHSFLVINQDEPYASEVWDLVLMHEEAKQKAQEDTQEQLEFESK
jgi:hypothetical protein